MGSSVRDVVYERLRRRGIPPGYVSTRFDDIIAVLNESFGECARIIVYKTMIELYQQYGMSVDFTYQDSLTDHMVLLRERVVMDHMVPRRVQRDDSALNYHMPMIQTPGPNPR